MVARNSHVGLLQGTNHASLEIIWQTWPRLVVQRKSASHIKDGRSHCDHW